MPEVAKKKGAYTIANALKLVKGGSEYFSLLKQLIDGAQSSIHLQVYIFDENATGLFVADALINAAERGVKVYLIVDDYASEDFSENLEERFKNAGVCFRRFEPLLQSKYFYFGRRLHHKVFVADSCKALVGGINISDRYNDTPLAPAWLDRALYAEGMVAQELVEVCCEVWNKIYDRSDTVRLSADNFIPVVQEDVGAHAIRIRINDWVRRRNEVWRSYIEMFNGAKEEIVIVCSYFMPGAVYRKRMLKAIKRGVKITVVLGGRSDIALSKYAERYLYRWMLENGIEIYEYQKNVLHAKLGLYDQKWMTIGSYNVNDISALASIELNLDVSDALFVAEVNDSIRQLIQEDCKPVTYDNYIHDTGWLKQKAQQLAYQLVKVMLFAVTFYYRRQKN